MEFELGMIKLNKYNSAFFLILFFLVFATSCKSKKKITAEPVAGYEEIIPVGKPHKNHEKGLRDRLVEEALTWQGTPYGFGHWEKGEATDCSGMVVRVYEDIAGMKLPRNSAEQAQFCIDIDEEDIEPGDLVFFATGSDRHKVSHVGLMIDGVSFIHASGSKGVIISEMTTPYYSRNFVKYGKVPGME